jgi:hypothetical protein
MKNLISQDPAPWASKLLALKHADPFQAFAVEMASGLTIPVTLPDYVEVTDDGTCAEVKVPGVSRYFIALEWVTGIEIGGEVGARPRYAAKLRALQADGPKGPLVISARDGRRFPLVGPLVAPDGRSVAVCEEDRRLQTSEITDLNPEPCGPVPSVQSALGRPEPET